METFLIVTTWGGVTTGTWWVEAKVAVQHPTMHRAAPQQGIIEPKMEIMLRLRNLDVKGKKTLFGNRKHNGFSNVHFFSVLHNNGAHFEFSAVPIVFVTR